MSSRLSFRPSRRSEADLFPFHFIRINDLFAHESAVTMEDLLRGLLDLPQRPAVLVARTIGLEAEVSSGNSFLSFVEADLPRSQMIAVGGDEHLPVAAYYDVPTISLRPVLLPLLFKEPARETEYFVGGEGWLDRRHVSLRSFEPGHPNRKLTCAHSFPLAHL